MADDQQPQQEPEKTEPTFDIKITNGAAKLLQKVMQQLGEESAKDAVGLGVQVLDFALTEGSDLIVKKANGEEVRIILKKKQ